MHIPPPSYLYIHLHVPVSLCALAHESTFLQVCPWAISSQVRVETALYNWSYKPISSQSTHACIIDDRLVVSSVSSMQGEPKTLRTFIDLTGAKICEHLFLSERNREASVQVPELAKDKNAPSCFAPCHQSFGSCILCMTDYRIDLYWINKKKRHVVELSMWCELGDCRSPFD
jgi:hypothetical protein